MKLDLKNIDLKSLTTLAESLSPWVSVGEAGVSIVLGVIDAVKDHYAQNGKAPTPEELHQIALDVRAAFEKLPKPD